jgi:hypothetical protein
MEAYETTSGGPQVSTGGTDWATNVSRGYTEEMEHFCHCIRTGNYGPPSEGGLRCDGVQGMADAVMALTANLAMKHKKRIEFQEEWFDPDSPAVPETDSAALA